MTEKLAKVRFELDSSDWHGHGSETLWAVPITRDPMTFRIANSPFFARGINHNDVVRASPSKDGTTFDFDQVFARAGHSTYMIIVEADERQFHKYWTMLARKGCSHESTHIDLSMGRRLLLSVDVPPSSNLPEVYDLLKKGESDHIWVFQEGYAYLPRQ